jgi:hypothetical protein
MVALSMFGLFLVLSYQPLLRIMAYPRWSQKVSRDRATVVLVERSITDNWRKIAAGNVWTSATATSTFVLLGQQRHYRDREKKDATDYLLYAYDRQAQTLLRYDLTRDQMMALVPSLHPDTPLSAADWQRLASSKNRSMLASHLVDFRFDLGQPTDPVVLELAACSFTRWDPDGPGPRPAVEPPVRRIRREMSKVQDEK